MKDLLDAFQSGGMHAQADQSRPKQCNGSKAKRFKTEHGPMELEVKRGRDSSFEPKVIGQQQTTQDAGLGNCIISLYSKDMWNKDIREYL